MGWWQRRRSSSSTECRVHSRSPFPLHWWRKHTPSAPLHADMATSLSSLTTPRAIAGVALPAAITSLAPPAAVALELALIARRGGAKDAGAFSATLTTAALVTSALNFLTVGVAAQVGAAVGARSWRAAAARVRVALVAALALGGLGAGLLLAVGPAARSWLKLESSSVPRFWALRAATVPAILLLSAVTGSLNGYGAVRTAAVLSGGSAAVEAAAVAVVLARSQTTDPLPTVGVITLSVALAASLIGVVAVRGAVAAHAGDATASTTTLLAADSTAEADAGAVQHGNTIILPPVDASPPLRALVLDFLRGGAAMFVRSMTLQLTFNAALSVAARQGTAALAAHAAASQLWLVTSYAADALEAAGVVLGSRIAGFEDRVAAKAAFTTLSLRVTAAGVAIGVAASITMATIPHTLARLFLGDASPAATSILLHHTMAVVAAAQPVCGAAFVSDGLVWGLRDFAGCRNVMVISFATLFAPVLAAGIFSGARGIWWIWLAKAAHNAGRLGGNLVVVRRAWAGVN